MSRTSERTHRQSPPRASIGATILLTLLSSSVALTSPVQAHAQLAVGDDVRVMQEGRDVFVGVVSAVSLDAFEVVGTDDDLYRVTPWAIDERGLTIAVRTGDESKEQALRYAAGLGALGFMLGYCVEYFSSDGCANNVQGGIEGALALAVVGIFVGSISGSRKPTYGQVDPFPGHAPSGPRLYPVITPNAVGIRVGLPGR